MPDPSDPQVDHTLPEGRWQFDENVTDVFGNMLSRSIPQYAIMRQLCFQIACHYQKHKSDIVDLGCSKGDAIHDLVMKYGAYNRFVGVEVSEPMLKAARERFKGYIDAGVVDIRNLDLRREYPPVLASVTMCVLTLQFTPIEHRHRILRNIWDHTLPGGALILVEKVLGSTDPLNELLVEHYHALKYTNGYSREEIERKALSLEGVLVPVTAAWNEDLLDKTGFRQRECFWRWLNFAGWVAIK